MMHDPSILGLATHQDKVLLKRKPSGITHLHQVIDLVMMQDHQFIAISVEKLEFLSYFDSNDPINYVEGTKLFFN